MLIDATRTTVVRNKQDSSAELAQISLGRTYCFMGKEGNLYGSLNASMACHAEM
jgi:hypothetical protein